MSRSPIENPKSNPEHISGENELKEMLAAEEEKIVAENKGLVKESEGELEVIRWKHRLTVTRSVLRRLVASGTVNETISFNRLTGILDVMHDDLKREDNSDSVRPGYDTPEVMVCLNVLDSIAKDNSSLGFNGQTPLKEFMNFINSEIAQLEGVLPQKENGKAKSAAA